MSDQVSVETTRFLIDDLNKQLAAALRRAEEAEARCDNLHTTMCCVQGFFIRGMDNEGKTALRECLMDYPDNRIAAKLLRDQQIAEKAREIYANAYYDEQIDSLWQLVRASMPSEQSRRRVDDPNSHPCAKCMIDALVEFSKSTADKEPST